MLILVWKPTLGKSRIIDISIVWGGKSDEPDR